MIAGAICLRRVEQNIEVLLIRTSSGKRYTFPKGHVEEEEAPATAALRELKEEAGYEAVPDEKALLWPAKGGKEPKLYVLMRDAQKVEGGEPGRTPTWMRLGKAILALCEGHSEEEVRELLAALKQAVKWFCVN